MQGKPLRSALFLAVLAASHGVLISSASAAVILDDTANLTATLSLPGTSSSLATASRGYSFTVGSSDISLQSITFGLYSNAAGTANVGVRLYSGSGSGSTLLQDSGVSLLSLNTIATAAYYTFSANWTLTANTTYSLMAYLSSGGTQTARLAVSGSSLTIDPLISGNGFYAATSTTSDKYAIRVLGVAVPEPSTWALGSAGLIAFVAFSRRRSRHAVA